MVTFFFALIETPIDPCIPNPCGENAICNKHPESEHASNCACIEGYSGDPCRPECTQNNDCPTNSECKNQKCVNPCTGLCGTNTVCSVSNHVPSCHCRQGYMGNPSVSCKLSMNLLACILAKALVPEFLTDLFFVFVNGFDSCSK